MRPSSASHKYLFEPQLEIFPVGWVEPHEKARRWVSLVVTDPIVPAKPSDLQLTWLSYIRSTQPTLNCRTQRATMP
ncbi:MAG: hypothetical protein OES12_12280, partial [Anaerolineae bacterium]|nr:hypothetical protein [Anaerolineae bacterium]